MPYIGHNPTNAGSFALIDDIASTFNGSNTTFTLQVGNVNITPNAQNTIIALDGVIQHTPESYTISGSTIAFTGAPASGTDFYGILMGNSSYVENNSIGADELSVSGDGTSLQVLASDGDGTFSWISQSALTPSANLVTGATLKSTVTASSLTSVGTLTGLSSSDHVVLNNNKYFKVKDTAGSDIRVIGLANSNDVYVGFIDDATGTGNLYLRTSATNALTIDSSQNATFAGGTTTLPVGGILRFGERGNLTHNSSNYNMTFNTNSLSSAMVITGTGKVGVHTQSPNVGGWNNDRGALTISSTDNASANNYAVLELQGHSFNSSGINGIMMFLDHTVELARIQSNSLGSSKGDIRFSTNNGSSNAVKMTITPAGDVLLGNQTVTDHAYQTLGIRGDASDGVSSVGLLTANASNTSGRNWGIASNYSAHGNLDFRYSNDKDGTPFTNLAMTIKNNGNVAIGGTGGYQKLSVEDGHIYMSGGYAITWANGNASINESSYALNFNTYDGSNVSTALNLYGNNTAQFHGNPYPSGNNTINLGASGARWSVIYTSNSVNVSDKTTKKYITDCDLGVDFINSLKPKSYKMKGLKEGHDDYDRKHFGLIAQDLIDTELNDSVFGDKDGEYSLAYNDLIAPMIKSIQELSAKVKELEKKCNCA